MAFGMRDRLIIRDREDGGFEQHWVTPGRRGMLTSWSPDSRLLALAGFRDDKLGVWVMDLVQGRFVRLSAEPSGRPAWTADGKLLTFDTKFGDAGLDLVGAHRRHPVEGARRVDRRRVHPFLPRPA